MSKNTRNYSRRDDDKQDTINKLKSQIKNLMKENRMLRSENKTLQAAWKKTKGYLQELHEDIPLEKVLEHKTYPKEPEKLPDVEKVKSKEAERETAREKWKNWNKGKK